MDKPERDMRQEWETPDDFFGVVNAEFKFQLDAAGTRSNRKCDNVIAHDLGIDALDPAVSWIDETVSRVWLNPGFAELYPWMQKAHSEAQKPRRALVVVMALIAPSTKWWRHWAMEATEIRLLGGRRVQFKAPPGIKRSSNARDNCLIVFRQNPHNVPPRIWTWDWTKELP